VTHDAPPPPLTRSYWAATNDGELFDRTSADVLQAAVRRAPDKVGLIDPGEPGDETRRWTFAEIESEAERVAALLHTHLEPGSHIAIFAANCPEWIFVQFGAALAGMVLVTVNPASNAAELAYILSQSRAVAVFHQAHYRGTDMGALLDTATTLEPMNIALRIDLDNPQSWAAMDAARASLPQPIEQKPDGQPQGPSAPHDPAMIQYTSGTTGKPKGVLLSHHQITNTSRIMAQVKELNESTVKLSVAPLFHTGGCVGGVLGAMQIGASLILMRSFDAERILDLIEAERATYTFVVPTMLIAMLEAQGRRARDLSSLTMVFSGGSTVPVDVVRRTEREFGVRLIIGYGLTESSPAITHTRPGDDPVDISETIGRAIPLVDVKIIDPASGETMPVGTPGELVCRGFNVMMGYYEMPEATTDTIDADGWLHTGDLCTMDARGYCRITGRIKDMIIRGGENIYPREIEEVLVCHPDVASVAVFAIADDYWGEQVGCALVPSSGAQPDADALRDHCSQSLARHKTPKFWFALDELPLTPSGKIQKFRLSEDAASGALDQFAL